MHDIRVSIKDPKPAHNFIECTLSFLFSHILIPVRFKAHLNFSEVPKSIVLCILCPWKISKDRGQKAKTCNMTSSECIVSLFHELKHQTYMKPGKDDTKSV